MQDIYYIAIMLNLPYRLWRYLCLGRRRRRVFDCFPYALPELYSLLGQILLIHLLLKHPIRLVYVESRLLCSNSFFLINFFPALLMLAAPSSIFP